VVIGLGVFQALRHRRPSPAGSAGGAGEPPEGELNALSKPAAAWSGEADLLAAQGRFREAIRALYLALLATLHRRGAIDYHPALSNWDYCRHFRGEPLELGPFRELTRLFDFGWYGHLGIDRAGYQGFKELVGPLLGRDGPLSAHAPAGEAQGA